MQTLEDAANIADDMQVVVDAWRDSDMVTLENELLASLKEHENLYENILVNRNRQWSGQIADLTQDDQDYLIVVGALHLVGDDSVIRMLQDGGLEPKPVP